MTELEFLPEDYLRARFHRRVGFIRSWLLLSLGMAMVLWSSQVGVWVRDARAELQALRGAGFAVEGDVEKVEMIRAEIRAFRQRVAAINDLEPKITVTEALASVCGLLPDGVVLEEVRLFYPDKEPSGKAALRITGLAPAEAAVNQALGQLEACRQFDHAVLVESKAQKRGNTTWRWFAIEADMVEAAAAEDGPR